MSTAVISTPTIRLPIIQENGRVRNPWNGKFMIEAGITADTHVITKCCHKSLRIGHMATDHGSDCGGSIPSNLPASEELKPKSAVDNHENIASVKIITLDVENRGKRDIAVNPFTNKELLAGKKAILFDEYNIDEEALEPVDPDFAIFDLSVTKKNYTRKFFDKAVITENGHLFNKQTLNTWLIEHRNQCPICRRKVTILTDRIAVVPEGRAGRPRLYRTHRYTPFAHQPYPAHIPPIPPSVLPTHFSPTHFSPTPPPPIPPIHFPPIPPSVLHLALAPPNTLLHDNTIRVALCITLEVAAVVGYISLLTLSSATFGASLLLLGASSMIFSAISSNEIKTGNRSLAEKILIVTTAIFIPAACSYYGAALLGFSATTQIATTVASVALPCIYHVANMLT
ncbi:hypothetical protein COB11_05625 [Candidatus Aerophobetes bacterium]|uniref:Uncharacterized protein n=1 Tax=Aerophobetes bacterium TaxID=2030807 RepID=A0A2A4YG23_UNCAE|nr:MAG: hypothetical protein COB11_05625 [Candidatus Aerophobetes bacterium]